MNLQEHSEDNEENVGANLEMENLYEVTRLVKENEH